MDVMLMLLCYDGVLFYVFVFLLFVGLLWVVKFLWVFVVDNCWLFCIGWWCSWMLLM